MNSVIWYTEISFIHSFIRSHFMLYIHHDKLLVNTKNKIALFVTKNVTEKFVRL